MRLREANNVLKNYNMESTTNMEIYLNEKYHTDSKKCGYMTNNFIDDPRTPRIFTCRYT